MSTEHADPIRECGQRQRSSVRGELTLLLLMLMMTAPDGATLVLYEVGGPVPLELFTVTGVCSSALTPEAGKNSLEGL